MAITDSDLLVLSENVKARRVAKGWTQPVLAAKAKIHRVTLAKLEAGQHMPAWSSACRLADALGVKLDWLRRRHRTKEPAGQSLPATDQPATVPE